MSGAKPNNGEDFAKNKITICANCMYPEKGVKTPYCYGTPQRGVDDLVNGGKKTEYYNPVHGEYFDTPSLCKSINDGKCPYYQEEPKKPSIGQRISALLKRGKDM